MRLADCLERAWLLGCSLCAMEGVFYEDDGDQDAAVAELQRQGWSLEVGARGPRVYCPACNA